MVKKCNDCQKQISFEKKGDKYYSLDLKKKSIYLCPSCWEVKKNNYKELLKEDVLKETIIQYKRYGYIDWQELDKNDEQIVSQVLVHKQELGQEKTDAPNSWEISHSISFTVCWGCDKWMEEKNEDHSNCQEIIAEKSEFEILKKRENKPQEGFLLNSREKQRLIELRNKYSKKQSNETTEDKQKKLFLAYFQQNNIKSAKLVNNKILLEYNSGDKETKEVNTGELQQISNYLKSINKKEISLSSLEQTKNRVTSSDNKSNFNLKSPLVIGGISVGILAILGSVIYFFTRNKTKDN